MPSKTRPRTLKVLQATPVSDKLIEESVAWIRQKLADTVFRGAVEVGDYLFDRFFGGDAARVSSTSPSKDASFSLLVERCTAEGLPVSQTWLNNAVGIAVVRRLLPGEATAFAELPPSHAAALLPLRSNPKKVEQLAERAVTAHLSVRDLRDLVASEKAKAGKDEPQRGRKPIPVVARALTRARAALFRDTQNFTKALINELNEDQLEQALADAKAMSASLTGLVASLEKRTSAR